jgi:CubicO group peptidase (beta-lactamase class C family)
MVDTGFHCPPEKGHRLTDSWYYAPGEAPKLLDLAEKSNTLRAPRFESGGGGLVSTTADYHRFCTALADGGGPLISPKTLALMTANHLPGGHDLTTLSRALFSEAGNAGIGFGLGFGVVVDPAKTLVQGSLGEFHWGGIHSTAFFVDRLEKLHMVFMTQLLPSSTYPIRRQLKTLAYAAMTRSFA